MAIDSSSCKIILKQQLDKNDYTSINSLKELCCNNEKISLKLELDYKVSRACRQIVSIEDINEFLYFEKDALVGYLGICSFGRNTMEINGMVHPEYRRKGIFKVLYSLAKGEWERRQISKVLLLCDDASVSGKSFINYTGAVYSFSEYEMILKNEATKPAVNHGITLRKALNTDRRELARQDSIYFNDEVKEESVAPPEQEAENNIITYMAELNGNAIGKIRTDFTGDNAYIYGFGVLPEYRHRGYGREILNKTIVEIKKNKQTDILLQVEAKNSNALNLYKSCGFVETSVMNYYEVH